MGTIIAPTLQRAQQEPRIMYSAFIGGFLGAGLAMHSGIAGILATIFDGIAILMALLFGVMVLWFLVVAIGYYVVIPLLLCGMAVIAAPFYVPFILVPWCLRRLFRTTPA